MLTIKFKIVAPTMAMAARALRAAGCGPHPMHSRTDGKWEVHLETALTAGEAWALASHLKAHVSEAELTVDV